jgi:hypothetical protein
MMRVGVEEIRRVPRELYERFAVWVEPTGMTRIEGNRVIGSADVVTVMCFWYPHDPEREREALEALRPYFPGERLVGHNLWFEGWEEWHRHILDRTYEAPVRRPVSPSRQCSLCGADGTVTELFGGRSSFVCGGCVDGMTPRDVQSEAAPCLLCGAVSGRAFVAERGTNTVCEACVQLMQEVRSGHL